MKTFYRVIPFICLLAAFHTESFAQEIDYTQYYLNLPGINPAFTGMNDYLNLNLGYRQGWNGFGVTNNNCFVSAYGALGVTSDVYLRKNGLRISSPDAIQQLRGNRSARRRQGIGGMAASRVVGPYTSVTAHLNYAYHLPLSDKLSFSLGTRVGYGSQRVDFNGYSVRDPINDEFYKQLMQSNPGNMSSVSLDFGSVLYSDHFYLAVSSANLGVKSLSGDPQLHVNQRRQFSLQTAVILPLGPSVSLNTGGKITQAEGYDLMWAVNSRIRFKELVYLGGGYSSNSRMSFLFGLSVSRNFTVNYAYDHYLAGVGALNVNVHEVVLGLAAFNRFDSNSRLW